MYTHKAIIVEAEENQSNLLKIKKDTKVHLLFIKVEKVHKLLILSKLKYFSQKQQKENDSK